MPNAQLRSQGLLGTSLQKDFFPCAEGFLFPKHFKFKALIVAEAARRWLWCSNLGTRWWTTWLKESVKMKQEVRETLEESENPVAPSHGKESTEVIQVPHKNATWLGPKWAVLGYFPQSRGPRADPGHDWGITSPTWFGNALGSRRIT